MALIKSIIFGCISLLVMSCSNDNEEASVNLAAYINNNVFEKGAVIACAASNKDTNAVLTFYYPEAGASNIRYYQTGEIQVDENDFSNYTQRALQSEPFFNGYLGRFTEIYSNEKWIIVTFELDGEIKLSNPIRSKQISKPTIWNDSVNINQLQSGMPNFEWQNNAFGDNAIYFQVVSNDENDLLSGTYTYENHFQYYIVSNVVLNVTTETPPSIVIGKEYNFTLMDVSVDNWVNWVVLKTFMAE